MFKWEHGSIGVLVHRSYWLLPKIRQGFEYTTLSERGLIPVPFLEPTPHVNIQHGPFARSPRQRLLEVSWNWWSHKTSVCLHFQLTTWPTSVRWSPALYFYLCLPLKMCGHFSISSLTTLLWELPSCECNWWLLGSMRGAGLPQSPPGTRRACEGVSAWVPENPGKAGRLRS